MLTACQRHKLVYCLGTFAGPYQHVTYSHLSIISNDQVPWRHLCQDSIWVSASGPQVYSVNTRVTFCGAIVGTCL